MGCLQVGRWCRGREAGQTLAEFALVMIILCFIVLGMVDFSRAVFARNMLASAAREGARYGITHPDDVDGIRRVATLSAVGLDGRDTARWNVVVTFPEDSGRKYIQVEVQYRFYPLSSYIERVMKTTTGFQLYGRAKMILAKERTLP